MASQTPASGSLLPPDHALPPLQQLREIVALLRGPGGCPWDQEQTHGSLRAGLLEEAYEVVAAIDSGDDANLCEELGDLLLQVFFHAQLTSESGRFGLDDVAQGIVEKLVRRHPHVFAGATVDGTPGVLLKWDEIKRAEKQASGAISSEPSLLEGLPAGLPALLHAQKVQIKAAKVGFDWSEVSPVFAKVREELAELEEALVASEAKESERELGDVLFSVVNLARQIGVDAEVALSGSTKKFTARFQAMERLARQRGLELEGLTLEEQDELWEAVKRGVAV